MDPLSFLTYVDTNRGSIPLALLEKTETDDFGFVVIIL